MVFVACERRLLLCRYLELSACIHRATFQGRRGAVLNLYTDRYRQIPGNVNSNNCQRLTLSFSNIPLLINSSYSYQAIRFYEPLLLQNRFTEPTAKLLYSSINTPRSTTTTSVRKGITNAVSTIPLRQPPFPPPTIKSDHVLITFTPRPLRPHRIRHHHSLRQRKLRREQ